MSAPIRTEHREAARASYILPTCPFTHCGGAMGGYGVCALCDGEVEWLAQLIADAGAAPKHELAKLRERYAEAVRALAEVEWGADPVTDESNCQWCLNERRYGHGGSCGVKRVLSRPEAQAILKEAPRG